MTSQRFSQLYLPKGEALSDSKRFRVRLYTLFYQLEFHKAESLSTEIPAVTGCEVPHSYGADWKSFFENAAVRDLLDAVSVIFKNQSYIVDKNRKPWIAGVSLIFVEENLCYRVDTCGIVHFGVDAKFEQNKQVALSALGDAKYSVVLKAFEAAYDALSKIEPDGKLAIREMFEAVESVFKLMCPSAARLGAGEIQKYLRSSLAKIYCENEVALNAAKQFVSGFENWTNACHQYRHGQIEDNSNRPPISLAVAFVDMGSIYLRWLAETAHCLQS